MIEKIADRLISIKSLVTLALTAIFAVLSLRGVIAGDQVLSVYLIIIGFYFGTQATKEGGGKNDS